MFQNVIVGAVIIFVARTFHIAIATLRLMMMTRGRRIITAILGFFEALIFAITIAQVVQNLSNIWNLVGYSLGFSAGLLSGLAIEQRLAMGFASVNVVSSHHSHTIAEAIRDAGFGATESWGRGSEGEVGVVRTVVLRRELPKVSRVVSEIDPSAFITIEDTQAVRRGYMRLLRR